MMRDDRGLKYFGFGVSCGAMQRALRCLWFAGLFVAVARTASASNDPAVLWGQATLYRDEWGVPHIYADNVRAMAFAFGYAQAEDHLETMLVAYRAAQGRLAEVFGESYANSDEFALQMAHGDLARAVYYQADELTRDLCEGFALGVNSWIIDHPASAPPWAEGLAPADVLAFMHYYLMNQAPFDFDGRYRRPPGTRSANAWAVGPAKSADGAATLVINPHTDYTDIFQWYEAHIVVANMLDMSGATLYGVPVIMQGHNATLGWALAPNESDFADVYVEPQPQFARNPKSLMNGAPDPAMAYYLKAVAESRPYYIRTASGIEVRRTQRMRTDRGPVVAQWAGRMLSYRVGGYAEFGALRQLFAMGQAATLEEFQHALTYHQLPCFHIVYADQAGNVFYLYNTKVGQKTAAPPQAEQAGTSRLVWDAPLSALDTAFSWGEVIAPTALPHLINPDAGYVQACGTPPWLVNDGTGTGPDDYPRWFARDADSYRAKRVRQLMAAGQRSFEDHQSMLFDEVAPFAVDAVPYLLKLAESNAEFVANAHPDLIAALDMLRDWNNVADTGSTAMTYFHVWWSVFRAHCPLPARSDSDFQTLLKENSPVIQQHALQSAAEAVKLMRNEFQTLNVPWGEVHKIRRGDRDAPIGGAISGEPLFATSDQEFINGVWTATHGPAFAMVVRFAGAPEAVSLVPFGSSDNPDSPHFDDQLDLLLERRLKVAHFARESVEQNATRATGSRIILRSEGAEVLIASTMPIEGALTRNETDSGGFPAGTAAFSEVVEPIVAPEQAPVQLDVRIIVPEALCAQGNLHELRVCGFDTTAGWYPLPEQALHASSREFQARFAQPMPVAVLGPARLRRAELDVIKKSAPVVPKPKDYTPLHLRRGHPGEIAPPAPREWLAMTTPPEFGESAAPPARPAPPVDMNPLVSGQILPESDFTLPAAAPSGEASAVTEAAAPPGTPDLESPPIKVQPAEPSETTPVQSHADLPGKGTRGKVMWSSKPLSELVTRPKTHHSLFLVPDNAIASPMQIGTDLMLRPPVPGTMFRLTTTQTVRAQVMVTPEAPGPMPDGLAAFTYGFTLECDPASADARTLVSIQLEPGVVTPESIAGLALYAYSAGSGWKEVAGQRLDAASRTFTGIDPGVNTYAVLGPATALLRKPSS